MQTKTYGLTELSIVEFKTVSETASYIDNFHYVELETLSQVFLNAYREHGGTMDDFVRAVYKEGLRRWNVHVNSSGYWG